MSGIGLAPSDAGEAEWLAGVAATDDVDGFNFAPINSGDVAEVRDIGPVLREHSAGVGVDFGLPGDSHAGTFEAEVEATDAREQ
jgi:hypothetical protein